MTELILSLVIISLAIAGMAVGVILSNKELKGSCGGLGAIMGEDCMYCEKEDSCKRKKDVEQVPNLLDLVE
jgi:hypothetical protein